jgi:aminocarboxymuconate-semialdehyde decarboxylase
VEVMNEDCVMLGSDCPFPLGEDKPGELIVKTFNNDLDTCAKLLNKNAKRFFKI